MYKLKTNEAGDVTDYKSRLVAQGFSQKYLINYTDTFTLVAKTNLLRTLLALSAHFDWEIHQMDIKSTYLHGEDLKEEIYMKQLPGFTQRGDEDKVLKLLKPLYRRKQARHLWNRKLHRLLTDLHFKRLESDHSVYICYDRNGKVIMAIHVDDIMMLCNSIRSLKVAKDDVKSVLDIKDLGELKWHLGMEFARDRKA